MNIIKDFKNDLLKRRELIVEIEAEQNPGIEYSKEEIVKRFKADKNLVIIKRVGSSFGSNKFKIESFIYDSAEIRDKVEPKIKEKKK